MEELRSTDILEKEILEDARKKAQRVLTKSEKDAKKILDSVLKSVNKTRTEKAAAYDIKIQRFREDLEASFPLEKERFLVSFENDAVIHAITSYIDSLSREKQLTLVEKLICRYKVVLKNKKVTAVVNGFEAKEIETVVKKVLGDTYVLSCKLMNEAEKNTLSREYENTKGAILETEDRSILCRAVIGELITEISDTYSYELTSTLFGGRLPE